MTRLAIFDYGAGNLHSLLKAIASDDRDVCITTDLREAMKAEDRMYGRRSRFGDDFDFLSVVRYLGNP